MTILSVCRRESHCQAEGLDASSSFSSMTSEEPETEEETDHEYLQALMIIDALRNSLPKTSHSSQRQYFLRKRESLSCLQDLLPTDEDDSVVARSSSHGESDRESSWGFGHAKSSRPPLCRPPLVMKDRRGIRRMPQR